MFSDASIEPSHRFIRICVGLAVVCSVLACTTSAPAQSVRWVQPQISARQAHAMSYDSARAVTVLFGGLAAEYSGETWEWNGAVWRERSTSGPALRYSHAMAYDAARNRTVLFGGYTPIFNNHFSAETWIWDGNSWTHPTVAGPSARYQAQAATSSQQGFHLGHLRFASDETGELAR